MNKNKKTSNKITLTVFANFRISNEERLQRMKDSFDSFIKSNPNQWVINIRGELKNEAGNYLKSKLRNKLHLSFKDSKKGWNFDTRELLTKIKSELVMVWVEDHILINTISKFKELLEEMYLMKIDILHYSFFTEENINFYSAFKYEYQGDNLNSWRFDKHLNKYCSKNKLNYKYSVPMMSIMRKDFFTKVLTCPRPYLKRWPISCPFDFEKKIRDKVTESYSLALPKSELFASIDDDHWNRNYSLISRGLYPNRISRENIKQIEYNSNSFLRKIKKIIPKKLLFISQKIYKFLFRVKYTIKNILVNLI